ncbi:hypothetical protein A0R60_3966 [Enterobacter asburiae]|nr:hypothetical protein A0R60_3966 [Enterobacter asburiae]
MGARLSGLNHIAELRARYGSDSGKELARFMADMRDKRDPFLRRTAGRWPLSFSWRDYPSPVMSAISAS